MLDKEYVICSNPDCKFSHHDVDIFKFCPECGSKTIDRCPDCGHFLRKKGQIFCHNCSQPIRTPAEATE